MIISAILRNSIATAQSIMRLMVVITLRVMSKQLHSRKKTQ
jgi:hypothetical protein